jgi:excisionase family DNA binding protein
MATIRAEITGRDDLEPLAVSPRQACRLLGVGNTRLYELINAGELDSYLDGRMRRITMDSIRARLARLLARAADTKIEGPRRRGRPQKNAGTRGIVMNLHAPMPAGFHTVSADELPHVVLNKCGRPVGGAGGYDEALRATACRGRA